MESSISLNKSHDLIKYVPPLSPFACVREHILERMGTAFETALTDVSDILNSHPAFAPYAFDIAFKVEEKGGKFVADKIRKVAIDVIRVSPSSPAINDSHFLTPPLTGPYRSA